MQTDKEIDRELDKMSWQDVLDLLRQQKIPAEHIGHAIVRVGKPYDEFKSRVAKDVIATYLNHPNSWARREAMWFLASWYRMKEYEPSVARLLSKDSDEDNRAYAAACIGRLESGTKEINALRILASVVRNPTEALPVRASSYDAMKAVFDGQVAGSGEHNSYAQGTRTLEEIDFQWVNRIAACGSP